MRLILIFLALLAPPAAAAMAEKPAHLVRVWQSEDGLPGNVVRSVAQDGRGFLWVATAEGIARFDGFEFLLVEPEGGLHRTMVSFGRLFALPSGGVLASTMQGGLFRIERETLVRVLEDTPRPNSPRVSEATETADGTVWFRRGGLVFRLEGDAAEAVARPPAEAVAALNAVRPSPTDLIDSREDIWQTAADGILTVTSPGGESQPVLLPRGVPVQAVNELTEDREGNVWAASSVQGLVRIRPGKIDVLDTRHGLRDPAVNALIQDRSGVWWLANRSGGIDRLADGEVTHFVLSGRGYRPVAALFEDSSGRIWAAARDGSVFRLEGETFAPQFSRTQFPSKVRAMAEDGEGTIWFGGSLGLVSLVGGDLMEHPLPGGAQDVSTLAFATDGRLLVGTTDGRIFAGNAGLFEDLGAPPQTHWISAILPITGGETWCATLGGGLLLWDGKSWHRISSDQGLPDPRLTTLLTDEAGNFWFGSLGGILRASRQELLAAAEDPSAAIRWRRFDRADGMPSRECIGGSQPAGWRGSDGRLWLPTSSGVVRIQPEDIERNRVPPPIHFEAVRANDSPLQDPRTPVSAGPGHARLEFRFVGISLAAPEKVTYRTRLAGWDDAWRDIGAQRSAAYEAVPPGNYTFEVIAVNSDGQPSQAPARLPVAIQPYFWQRPTFIAAGAGALLLVAAGSGWLVARSRMKRRMTLMKIRHARENERSRIARDLHDDLGASLTEISILAALAAEDASGSDFQPSLDQLSQKAKNVVGTLDEIVWAVNPREDTLRSLVDYLAAFAREFLALGGVALRVEIPRDIPDRPLAAGQRHGVFLAARESLNNILKHARASEVRLAVAVPDHHLEIRIRDNGRGFDPEEHRAGNGLDNLRHRMAEAGGTCEIESSAGSGTTVTLSLPTPAPTPSSS